MEEENQQLQQCTNCLKDFPVDKIDLHEAYCCRNIRRCQHCSNMVDIKDMDEHIKENHSKKPCSLCQQEFQPSQLSKHEAECPRRPVTCKFCENQFAHVQFARHEQMCGARTQPCSICNRLVSLRDIAGHENRCARRRQQRREEREASQDNYRRPAVQRADRERQNSTNNAPNRSNSIKNASIVHSKQAHRPQKIKPNNIIGPEMIRPSIDPIPISIRLAMKGNPTVGQNRPPLKSKN